MVHTRWNKRKRRGVNWSLQIPALLLKSNVTAQSAIAPFTPQQNRILARAVAFLSEESTMQWVRDMNFQVGASLKFEKFEAFVCAVVR